MSAGASTFTPKMNTGAVWTPGGGSLSTTTAAFKPSTNSAPFVPGASTAAPAFNPNAGGFKPNTAAPTFNPNAGGFKPTAQAPP